MWVDRDDAGRPELGSVEKKVYFVEAEGEDFMFAYPIKVHLVQAWTVAQDERFLRYIFVGLPAQLFPGFPRKG